MGYLINITIKSDYYAAWASYINERTLADAVVDAKNKTVNISRRPEYLCSPAWSMTAS